MRPSRRVPSEYEGAFHFAGRASRASRALRRMQGSHRDRQLQRGTYADVPTAADATAAPGSEKPIVRSGDHQPTRTIQTSPKRSRALRGGNDKSNRARDPLRERALVGRGLLTSRGTRELPGCRRVAMVAHLALATGRRRRYQISRNTTTSARRHSIHAARRTARSTHGFRSTTPLHDAPDSRSRPMSVEYRSAGVKASGVRGSAPRTS